jgi:DNA-binding transcriptional ArsR family regulator
MSREPEDDVVVLTDPTAIRAMAHPARLVVIDALYDRGTELTATQAAAIAGITPSAMSYHLRALERFGIVKRAPSKGDARERPWIRAARSLNIGRAVTSRRASAMATNAIVATALESDRDRLFAALERLTPPQAPVPLDAVTTMTRASILVTVEEAKSVLAAMQALAEPYLADARDDAPDTAGRLWLSLVAVADADHPGTGEFEENVR